MNQIPMVAIRIQRKWGMNNETKELSILRWRSRGGEGVKKPCFYGWNRRDPGRICKNCKHAMRIEVYRQPVPVFFCGKGNGRNSVYVDGIAYCLVHGTGYCGEFEGGGDYTI